MPNPHNPFRNLGSRRDRQSRSASQTRGDHGQERTGPERKPKKGPHEIKVGKKKLLIPCKGSCKGTLVIMGEKIKLWLRISNIGKKETRIWKIGKGRRWENPDRNEVRIMKDVIVKWAGANGWVVYRISPKANKLVKVT